MQTIKYFFLKKAVKPANIFLKSVFYQTVSEIKFCKDHKEKRRRRISNYRTLRVFKILRVREPLRMTGIKRIFLLCGLCVLCEMLFPIRSVKI